MTGALLSFSAMAVSIRGLAGTLSIFEILTARSAVAVIVLLSLAALRPEIRVGLRPRRMGLNFLRNSIHFASQFAWALAITLLSFATVFALEFSMPVWVAILAVIFLGECHAGSHRCHRARPDWRTDYLAAGFGRFSSGLIVSARGGFWLRGLQHSDQEINRDREHIRYCFLDERNATADGPRRQ